MCPAGRYICHAGLMKEVSKGRCTDCMYFDRLTIYPSLVDIIQGHDSSLNVCPINNNDTNNNDWGA